MILQKIFRLYNAGMDTQRGRPPKSDDDRREIRFQIRVSPTELEQIGHAADGKTSSGHVRCCYPLLKTAEGRVAERGGIEPDGASRTLTGLIRPLRRQDAGRSPNKDLPARVDRFNFRQAKASQVRQKGRMNNGRIVSKIRD